MWAQHSRLVRLRLHRTVRFSRRRYNGQTQGPHTTYFQPPPQPPSRPPRRIFRSILYGTACLGLGAYAHSWLFDTPFLGIDDFDELDEMDAEGMRRSFKLGAMQEGAARSVPPMDLESATGLLELRANMAITPKAVSHSCQLPSNMPGEDFMHSGVYELFNDPAKDWATWSVLDGHAGPRTAQALVGVLPETVGWGLSEAKCMDRPYIPNDPHIVNVIKDAFRQTDGLLLNAARERLASGEGDMSNTLHLIAPALSGSCALLTLFDPVRSILRVANTGDSRAVLGRWNSEAGKYVAQPMSVDQTGFNQDEVDKLKREHPGEECVDPSTGRVHGIAVSRAFGDARWKWPQELSRLVHEKFWGPTPRPDNAIKTPPYLTPEPEVMETKVQTGQHPDFLIMASDGLWDKMSSEDAVTCVHQWLDKYSPSAFLDKISSGGSLFKSLVEGASPDQTIKLPPGPYEPTADDDTYFNAEEGCMHWRVSPKHFVVEDEHCGIHLIKNALGGSRRNLFCGVMTVQPPRSRNVRDDISVHVIFFGVDALQHMKEYQANGYKVSREKA